MGQPTILVVDDFAVMRDLVVHQLKLLGLTDVHTASNGEDALKLLAARSFSLVLSDWSMPGMSGLDLLIQVRRTPALARLPFILVTAEIQREKVSAAIEAKVSDFLLKPFRPEELEKRIHAALGGQRLAMPAQAAPVAAPLQRQTVLVVDDTPANLTLVGGLLRDDYQVKLAARGDKALQLCATSAPDLVLLDLMMPEMDGFEVCRRLKADPATAHIPVIFLTAVSDASRTVEGLALGAVDYVSKPIEPMILKARVATALRTARDREALRAQFDLALENARLREEVERITRHDLHNPLAAIIGMSSAMLLAGQLNEEQNRQLVAIERTASDMLDMLKLSALLLRMEAGDYQPEPLPVDLAALLQRVADESRGICAGRHIDIVLELGAPRSVAGNQLLLYSMLHNLVRNATEASTAGDTVRITLAPDGQIRIHNRAAVPEVMRERFFEKYATSGKENGSGLGTYSARLITQAHGGSISMITSEIDGTTLTIELPAK
ncbi:response regulator [Duganella qianjiadongensis]|uniref:histidine kinase n=1 Tax=Duganella qianjiadongensis TaxID=2692176 RepID=A0ABW9VIA6_9BURK|nr:response regulator [Duganella qianjiadongensis]MYM39183.1 response regulator [Duganella qianjiadongensis]